MPRRMSAKSSQICRTDRLKSGGMGYGPPPRTLGVTGEKSSAQVLDTQDTQADTQADTQDLDTPDLDTPE